MSFAARRGRGVGDDQIQLVNGQISQQEWQFVLPATQARWLIQFQGRFEEMSGQRFCHDVHNADGQSRVVPICSAPLHDFHQLLSGREDVFRVSEYDVTHLCQHEAAPSADEQLFSQRLLQQPYLPADRRLSQAEIFAGFGHAAVLCNGPKI